MLGARLKDKEEGSQSFLEIEKRDVVLFLLLKVDLDRPGQPTSQTTKQLTSFSKK